MSNLNAETRQNLGRRHTRRLRKQEKVPAIIYGLAKKKNIAITLQKKELAKLREQAGYRNKILTVQIKESDKKIGAEQVIVKAMQMHPTKLHVMHVDLLRIDAKTELTLQIPIHFIHEEDGPGVKQGGVVNRILTKLEIQCLPTQIPKAIEVDLSQLELNQTLHLSDIAIPKGVTCLAIKQDEKNPPVVSVHIPVEKVTPSVEEGEDDEATETEEKTDETKAE